MRLSTRGRYATRAMYDLALHDGQGPVPLRDISARQEISENLKLQVSTARNKYQFALDQFQTSKENLSLAESIADKEQIKFFEGLSSSIDLTNTQNQLFGSQQDYIQSILEIIQSKVELENALNLF